MNGDKRTEQALLTEPDIERLCLSLISEFQDDLIRKGEMSRDVQVPRVLAENEFDTSRVSVDEDILGIDSLSLLDLVMGVNQFFDLSQTGVEDYLLVQRRITEWTSLISHHFRSLGARSKICFSSSGTTGKPKRHAHDGTSLMEEVVAIASLFQEASISPDQILSAVPPHHIYGFIWSILLPAHLGAEVIGAHDKAPSSLAKLCSSGNNVVLGTPYLWENYAKFGIRFPDGTVGVTSGAPSSDKTWTAALACNIQTLLEVYGSTETGGIGTRFDQGPFRLLPHLTRRGSSVVRGIERHEVPLQDHIDWTDKRSFRVIGRVDGKVQVAGTNVSLDRVKEVMLRHPHVEDVAIRVADGRLKAFVVTRNATPREEVEGPLRESMLQLPAVARPGRIEFGRCLPVNAIGKLADW